MDNILFLINKAVEEIKEKNAQFKWLKNKKDDLQENIENLEEKISNSIDKDNLESIIDQTKRLQSYKCGEFITFNFDEELDKLIELVLGLE